MTAKTKTINGFPAVQTTSTTFVYVSGCITANWHNGNSEQFLDINTGNISVSEFFKTCNLINQQLMAGVLN